MRLIFALAFLVACAASARAETRVALVIGEAAYQRVGPLPNPASDATAIADLLKNAGFSTVRLATDRSRAQLQQELRDFADLAETADIAVFYFAGHGVEIGGTNYLVPIDADLRSDLDAEDQAIDLDYVLKRMESARKLKLVILDACRENPFKIKSRGRSIGRGLAPPAGAQGGTLIAFAAQPGAIAADGEGGHSPYAQALLNHIAAPGVELGMALRRVHDEVLRGSGRNRQEPWTHGAIGAEAIYFGPRGAGPAAMTSPDASQSGFEVAGTVAAMTPGTPVVSRPSGPCGGVTLASLRSRSPTPLSTNEECALAAKAEFQECEKCPKMNVVPAGTFTMGSPEGEKGRSNNEGPRHDVTVSRPFAVGKFHVTVDEFKAFVSATGYDAGSSCLYFDGKEAKEETGRTWRAPGHSQTGTHPVACVSWMDAQAYAAWVSQRTGKTYRLLSESEWEYSARGRTSPGTYPRHFFGDVEASMCKYGNGLDATATTNIPWAKQYSTFSCSDGAPYTSSVGSYSGNDFGLYDMHGNLWQWVQDCYHENYSGAPADGSTWTSGDCSRRVLRGGSWSRDSRNLRAADRIRNSPDSRMIETGLRLARTLYP